MSIKRHIPNALTLGNVVCGCLGITAVLESGDLQMAAIFMLVGLVFDFLDGMMARLLGVSGELGKQLDSLADAVTFGVLPGVVVYHLLDGFEWQMIAFVIPALSVLRLAKFNLDTRQSENFIGLPTPAHAVLWMGWALVVGSMGDFISNDQISSLGNPWLIGGVALITSLLTVSEIPMFSLKFKNMTWASNKIRFVFLSLTLVISLLLVLMTDFLFLPIPIVILLYLLLSIINNLLPKRNEIQS